MKNIISKPVIGGVYETEYTLPVIDPSNPNAEAVQLSRVKVLVFDEVTVLMDDFWPSENCWLFDYFKGSTFYTGTSYDLFCRTYKQVGLEPLTEKEYLKHWPQLPLRIGRIPNVSWIDRIVGTDEEYEFNLKNLGVDIPQPVCLETPKVFIYPYGPNSGMKSPRLIKSDNGKSFSLIELLRKANNVQVPHLRKPSNGIGLYRGGTNNKDTPSYYTYDYWDQPGHLKMKEAIISSKH